MQTNEKSLSQQFLEVLKLINVKYEKNFQIHSNLDGQYNGILFEFKKNKKKNNWKADALKECIKNASHLRLLAKDVPAKFAIVPLEEKEMYIYDSIDFFEEIHKVYSTSASNTNNEIDKIELSTRIEQKELIQYGEDTGGYSAISSFINRKELGRNSTTAFLKVEIDRNNVVQMAERFYKEKQAKKKDFYNELIKPDVLKYIKPFAKDEAELNKKSLEQFPDLVDKINDIQLKKETGAFYTPSAYVELSTEMVRDAIKRIKQANPNNDYIILDRCAGTGGLEQFFNDEELSHCVCSTFEMWEWEVLNERYKSAKPNQYGQYTKLRLIIPPSNFILKQRKSTITQIIKGGDALSEHFITGKVKTQKDLFDYQETEQDEMIKEYEKTIETLNGFVANPNCNIIVLENPPYKEDLSGKINYNNDATHNESLAYKEFVEDKISNDGASMRDIANLFLYSAKKHYLKKENDYCVFYSPCKYFKATNIINKDFIKGYLLNREEFHATPSAISLMMWQNSSLSLSLSYRLPVMEINKKNKAVQLKDEDDNNVFVEVKKVKTQLSTLYDKSNFANDVKNNTSCTPNGYEILVDDKNSTIYNDNLIAYLFTGSFAVDAKNVNLLTRYFYIKARGGFYLRSDNFITKLPLFCAKLYPQENWWERDVYFTTADKGEEYVADKDFLKKCLIFTCLSQRNHCRTFKGTDGRMYYNELCLLQDTLSDKELAKFELDDEDKKLIEKWQLVLNEAKRLKPDFEKWGLYQIEEELTNKKKSTKKEQTLQFESDDEDFYYGTTQQEITAGSEVVKYDNSNLMNYIKELKDELKIYYKSQIQDKLFKYELLK